MWEKRKHQFFGFVIILLIVGFLNYYRKIMVGLKLSRTGKIMYLSTMIIFVTGIMYVLYFTNISNIEAFFIGLFVTTLSEQIAKLFLNIGDNFTKIFSKILKKFFNLDVDEELLHENKNIKNKYKTIYRKHKN